MKHAVQCIYMGSLIMIFALFFSCSDSEPRTGLLGQTSTVIINLGMPSDQASDSSIFEKMRHFFVRDAIAQTAPAFFSSIKVRVTAADFGIIEKEFNPYGTISLNVPSGTRRNFEVITYVAPGDPSAAASFRGTVMADCPAGETVIVPISMSLNETKIITPDNFNSRIVVKNSMHSGWNVITTFQQPMDIDYDSRGRMYIVD